MVPLRSARPCAVLTLCLLLAAAPAAAEQPSPYAPEPLVQEAPKPPFRARRRRGVTGVHGKGMGLIDLGRWPNEPGSGECVEPERLGVALQELCRGLPADDLHDLAVWLVEYGERFGVDPMTLGALVYRQSRCDPRRESDWGLGLAAINPRMHQAFLRRGVYRYWVVEDGAWTVYGVVHSGAKARQGEVLVRGPGVFAGYFRDDEATEAAFNERGFFRTGDLGRLDDDGYLRITGRKKDLIVTAGGKNVSPSNIENVLKSHPLVGQAMVIGDERPFLTALISLEPEDAADWARSRGLRARAVSELVREPAVLDAVARHVDDTNARLGPWETIKKHAVLPVAFTQASGHLTPTLKVKRRAILRDFGDVVEGLYGRPRS